MSQTKCLQTGECDIQSKCAAEIEAFYENAHAAEQHAEYALYYAKRIDYEEAQAAALFAYYRVFAMNNRWTEVRRALCEVASLRRSERTYVRRELWLWWVGCFSARRRLQFNDDDARVWAAVPARIALRQAKARIARQQGWYR